MTDIIEFLTKYFTLTPSSALTLLILGYLFLFTFFFDLNKRKWRYKFSDLDKIVLTMVFGLYLHSIIRAMAFPLYKAYKIFSFNSIDVILNPTFTNIDSSLIYSILWMLILVQLFLFLYSEKERKEKLNEFLKFICDWEIRIVILTLAVIFMIISEIYREIVISMILNLIFYSFTFLVLISPLSAYIYDTRPDVIIKEIKKEYTPIKRKLYVIYIIIIISSLILGNVAIKPSIKAGEKEVTYIKIEGALFSDSSEIIKNCDKSAKQIKQTFQIQPKFLKWVPIKTDFNITECYIDGQNKVTKKCSGNMAVVNYSNRKAFNLTIRGEEYFNYSKIRYKYEKFYDGDNITVNITIFNTQPCDIEFNNAFIHIHELYYALYKFVDYYPKYLTREGMEVELEPKKLDHDGQFIFAENIKIKANRNWTFSVFLSKKVVF